MQTWDEVAQATRAAIDEVEEEREDFAILSLADDDRYVQWTLGNTGALRVEVSSNEALGQEVLSPADVAQLRAMGIDVADPDPNYVYEPATAAEATDLVVRVVREVFGVQPAQIAEVELG
ncbi:TY-Chap domain-containing protein [Geodermatophilus sp. SYSU D00742]